LGGGLLLHYEYSTDNKANWLTVPSPSNIITLQTSAGNMYLANGTAYTVFVRAVTSVEGVSTLGTASTGVTAIPSTLPTAPVLTSVSVASTQLTPVFADVALPAGAKYLRYEYDLDNASQWSALIIGAVGKLIYKEDNGGVAASLCVGRPFVAGSINGTALAATFKSPQGIARDLGGNLYVADTGNHTIRKITPAGDVTTFAGSVGVPGSVNATGTAASFNGPKGLAMDFTNGVLYVADTGNHTIRKIVLSTAAVTTLAGTAGTAGRTTTTFNSPSGICWLNNMLYVADTNNNQIRSVNTSSGVVTLFSGDANGAPYSTGNPENTSTSTSVKFNAPQGLVAVSGTTPTLYVADTGSHTIRALSLATGASLASTTFSGAAGSQGYVDGLLTSARYSSPTAIAVEYGTSTSVLYVTDLGNNVIRRIQITRSAGVTTHCGFPSNVGYNDGAGNAAYFNGPCALVTLGTDYIFLVEKGSHIVRRTDQGTLPLVHGTPYEV
jgi:sugar lactone lactonase YvrE